MTNKDLKFNLPKQVDFIIETLEENGYEAYLVGGAVRDLVMGKVPKDYDITTNAKSDEVIEIFETKSQKDNLNIKILPIGKAFGIIALIIDGEQYEVATFRNDGEYADGRRPKEVNFVSTIEEDLARRDFTINAMAYNHKTKIIDPFEGLVAIKNKEIESVGNSSARYSEDHLRMLRAIRLGAQLGFSIQFIAYHKIGATLESEGFKVSQERIQSEFNKILLSNNSTIALTQLYDTGLLEYIVPELCECVGFDQCNPHHDKDVFDHICRVVEVSPFNIVSRLSALFHDIGKPQTLSVGKDGIGHFYNHHAMSKDITIKRMRALKYDNKTIELVASIVENHMYTFANPLKEKHARRFISKLGEERANYLLDLRIADRMGSLNLMTIDKKGSKPSSSFEEIYKMKFMVEDILSKEEVLNLHSLDIDGYDLMSLGYEGKDIGEALDFLLEEVLEGRVSNNKEALKGRLFLIDKNKIIEEER